MVKLFSAKSLFIRLSFILFIFSAAGSFAQNISVRAYTDTTDYYVGDHIRFNIDVEYDKNISIFTPDIKKSISNVDVLSEDKPETVIENDRIKTTYKFVLSRYDSAEVIIPPVPVKYGTDIDTAGRVAFLAENDTTLSTAYSNQASFKIHLLQVNVEEDIRDIKAPITIPPDWRIIALWIAGGLILAGLLFYIYRRIKRNRKPVPVKEKIIIIPAHIKALDDLKKLDQEKLWQKGEIKAYHTRITEIIRTYFEERFNLPALELSTTEILEHVKSHSDMDKIILHISDFFNNADLVKFAKYVPMNSINEEMMIQAVEIVKITSVAEVSGEVNV